MPRESKADRTKRTAKITAILKKQFPDARTALNWSNPLELLVATILSAQCTDVRVNIVTKDLFRKYRAATDYADASQQELEKDIRTAGLFRNKARNIRGAAARIVEDFGGEVPSSMDELLTLPGVARKSANVVLGDAFDKREGIVVDTHVMRLSGRLKLSTRKNNQGDKLERDLIGLVPRTDWIVFAHLLVYHGRGTCTARKPNCERCPIVSLCPSVFQW